MFGKILWSPPKLSGCGSSMMVGCIWIKMEICYGSEEGKNEPRTPHSARRIVRQFLVRQSTTGNCEEVYMLSLAQ